MSDQNTLVPQDVPDEGAERPSPGRWQTQSSSSPRSTVSSQWMINSVFFKGMACGWRFLTPKAPSRRLMIKEHGSPLFHSDAAIVAKKGTLFKVWTPAGAVRRPMPSPWIPLDSLLKPPPSVIIF